MNLALLGLQGRKTLPSHAPSCTKQMGDVRYTRTYDLVKEAPDRMVAIRGLDDEQVVEALTAAALRPDPFLANILATEATNRVRRLRSALANLGEGVLALDIHGTIQWMNPAAEQILGLSRQDAVAKPFSTVIEHVDEGGQSMGNALVSAASRRETVTGDGDRFRVASTLDIPVTFTCAPILGPDGDPEGAVLAFRDCGERLRTEREQRESWERYKVLFDRSTVGIVTVAVDGTIVDANPAAERITAIPLAISRGRPWPEFVHPEDMPLVARQFQQILDGQEVETRFRLFHGEGDFVEVQARGLPVVVNGKVVSVHVLVFEEDPGAPDPPSRAMHG